MKSEREIDRDVNDEMTWNADLDATDIAVSLNVAKSNDEVRLRSYTPGIQVNTIRLARGDLKSPTMSHDTPSVFVVDDDSSMRKSLASLIGNAGWQPVTFESAQEFLSHPRVLVPSCLILDVTPPGLNGLELQKRVARDRTDMPVIFITGYGDVPMMLQAMKAGAIEFLIKPFADEILLSAIRQALERSRTALDREAEIRGLRERHDSLSRREREVMALVVRGLLNKQVGFELGISEITVKAHRGRVMRKMQAGSLADLVIMAARLLATSPQKA
jgi:FixJ family two-component response regulator